MTLLARVMFITSDLDQEAMGRKEAEVVNCAIEKLFATRSNKSRTEKTP